MAKLLSKSLKIEIDLGDRDWVAKEEAQIHAAQKVIRDKRPEDDLAGEIIRFPVADNYARYMVERSKPLTLRHVGSGDLYSAHPALIRGLRLVDVKEMVRCERATQAMFPGGTR